MAVIVIAFDGSGDFVCRFGPFVGLGVFIVRFDEGVDVGLEFCN